MPNCQIAELFIRFLLRTAHAVRTSILEKMRQLRQSVNLKGLGINEVVAMYYPLHEADLTKFADAADSIISRQIPNY